jgi:hypothetical protein
MLQTSLAAVVISCLTHMLNRYFHVFESGEAMHGMSIPVATLEKQYGLQLNMLLLIPIIIFAVRVFLYFIKTKESQLDSTFEHTDGDGYGDLAGVIAKLDHIQNLGVNVIWLMNKPPKPL